MIISHKGSSIKYTEWYVGKMSHQIFGGKEMMFKQNINFG